MLKKLRQNSLVSGSAIYLISNILNAAVPLALLPVLTRYLSPAEYGEVAMFQTLLGLLGAFVGLSVAGAAGRKYYDNDVSDREVGVFIATCVQIMCMSASLVFCIFYILKTEISIWIGLPEIWVLYSVPAAAGLFIIRLLLVQWQVRQHPVKYGVLQISSSVFIFLLTLLLVVVFLYGAEGRLYAQLFGTFTFSGVAMLILYRSSLLRFQWHVSYFKQALCYGVPLIPHVGGLFLLSSVDRLVINNQLGLDQVGIYMVAVQLVGGMAIIFDAFNKAYVPWLYAKLKINDFQNNLKIVKFTYFWFGLVLFGAFVVAFLSPFLIDLVAGPNYQDAVGVMGWLALGQAFSGMYLMVTNYILFSRRTGLLSAATIITGVINIAILLLLVPMLGLKGAAISFCVAMFFRFIFIWFLANKCHPMPWFLWRSA